MAPIRLLGILFLLCFFLHTAQSDKTKKKIKIHVPVYVKHIHHYKKVYVPKVQVVKHEHVHKKEHEHHHHHDHHSGHQYDKADQGRSRDTYEPYYSYEDLDHRNYETKRLPKTRRAPYPPPQLQESDEDYYSSDEDEGIVSLPRPINNRPGRSWDRASNVVLTSTYPLRQRIIRPLT